MEILLADKQDITRAGLVYVLSDFNGVTTKYVEDKSELLLALQNDGNRVIEMLLVPMETAPDRAKLTPTENEILKDIALGMTTREIAEKRFSSFHTVNTHRKNIFRKLGVNTIHEATKYALRAGLVDSAEYYI